MDGVRFDEITRRLVPASSRRRFVRTVAAALGVAFPVLAVGESAQAACRAPGKPCRRDRQCCSRRCHPSRRRCRGCGKRKRLCGDGCRNLHQDEAHCGACDAACPAGGRCLGGACFCPAHTDYCGNDDVCADLVTDPAHCGSCSTNCGADTCLAAACCPDSRVCASGCCPPDLECLDGLCCTDIRRCPDRCCPDGQACIGGECCIISTDPGICDADAQCCRPDPGCVGGSCTCPTGATCGPVCCPPGWQCQDPLSGVCVREA